MGIPLNELRKDISNLRLLKESGVFDDAVAEARKRLRHKEIETLKARIAEIEKELD